MVKFALGRMATAAKMIEKMGTGSKLFKGCDPATYRINEIE